MTKQTSTIAILVGLAVVGLAAWFFFFRRSASSSSGLAPPQRIEGGSKPSPTFAEQTVNLAKAGLDYAFGQVAKDGTQTAPQIPPTSSTSTPVVVTNTDGTTSIGPKSRLFDAAFNAAGYRA